MHYYILDNTFKTVAVATTHSSSQNAFAVLEDNFQQYANQPSTLELTFDFYHESTKYLTEGSHIIFEYMGKQRMFTIIEVEEQHAGESYVSVYAEEISFQLLDSIVMPFQYNEQSLEFLLQVAIEGTDFEIGEVANISVPTFDFGGYETALSNVKKLAEETDTILSFNVEFSSTNGFSRKFINLTEKAPENKGKRLEFGRNVESVRRTVDRSQICTAVIPVGENDTLINGVTWVNNYSDKTILKQKDLYYLEVNEETRNAINPNTEHHIFATINVESSEKTAICQKAYEHLTKHRNPKYTYEVDAIVLNGEEYEIGEQVNIIDDMMNVSMTAEVEEISISFCNPDTNTIKLTNYIEKKSNISQMLLNMQNKLQSSNLNNPLIVISPNKPLVESIGKEGTIWFDTSQNANGLIVLNKYDTSKGEWITVQQTPNKEFVESATQEALKDANAYAELLSNGRELAILKGSTFPTTAIEGQLFIHQGDNENLYRWNGSEWVLVGASQETVNGIVAEVENARKETAEALENIESVRGELLETADELTKTANELTGTVEELEQTATQLRTEVEGFEEQVNTIQTEVNNVKGELTSKASKTEVTNAINNLEIGGRNLLKNSNDCAVFSNNPNNYPITCVKSTQAGRDFWRIRRTEHSLNPTTFSVYSAIPYRNITKDIAGKTVMASFWMRCSHAVNIDSWFRIFDESARVYSVREQVTTEMIPNEWMRISCPMTIPTDVGNDDFIRINPYQTNIPSGEIANFWLDFCEIQIEEGNKVTSWSLAPEDTQSQIDAHTQKITQAETNITQNAEQIALRATKTEVTTAVNNLEIGGRNYILNSANLVVDCLSETRSEYQEINVGQSYMNIPNNTKCVLSFDLEYHVNTIGNWTDAKGNQQTGAPFFIIYNTNKPCPKSIGHNYLSRTSAIKTDIFNNVEVGDIIQTRLSIPITITDRENPTLESNCIEFYSGYDSNNRYKVSNIKLEIGNKATDWTPAPEDVDEKINAQANRITKAETSITQNAEQIALRATKTEVTTAIDNIEVGGRNLILNSGNWKNIEHWVGRPTITTKDGFTVLYTSGSDIQHTKYYTNLLEAGQEYVVTAEFMFDKEMTSNQNTPIHLYIKSDNYTDQTGAAEYLNVIGGFKTYSANEWHKYSVVFKIKDDAINPQFKFHLYPYSIVSNCQQWLKNVKLEKGNKPTDWTPAPEDTQSQIDEQTEKISQAETAITQNAEQIALRATKTEVTTAVNNIKIGGTNLIAYKDVFHYQNKPLTIDPTNGIISGENCSYFLNVRYLEGLEPETEYTISVGNIEKTAGEYEGALNCRIWNIPSNSHVLAIGSLQPNSSITFTTPANFEQYNQCAIYVYVSSTTAVNFTINGLKLEKGNKATAYSPCPQDIQNQFDTQAERISQAETSIEQNAEQIALRATKTEVTTAIDNISIGGRNLLINSKVAVWRGNENKGITVTDGTEFNTVVSDGTGHWHSYGFKDGYGKVESELQEGDEFTFSVAIRSDNATKAPQVYFKSGMGYYKTIGTVSDKWSRIYYTGIWKDAQQVALHFGWSNCVGTYYLKEYQIEKGNKATAWKESPEDTQNQIDAHTQKITQAETNITQNAEQIGLRATKTEVTNTVNTAINNIEFGSRNLIIFDPANFTNYNTQYYTKDLENYTLYCGTESWGKFGFKINKEIFEENKEYVLTFKVRKLVTTGQDYNIGGHCPHTVRSFKVDGVNSTYGWDSGFTLPDTTEVHTVELKFFTDAMNSSDANVYPQINRGRLEAIYSCEALFSEIMLEQATKASDWQPSPEDIAKKFATQGQRITEAEANIAINSSEISSKVSKSEFEGTIGNIGTGRNMIIRSTETKGYYIDQLAQPSKFDTHAYSDWIKIEGGKKYTFSKTTTYADPYFRIQWYDSTKTYLSRVATNELEFTYQFPANANYVIVSYPMDAKPKMELGEKATPFSLAPEDVEHRVTTAETNISQKADSVTVTAMKTELIQTIKGENLIYNGDGKIGNNTNFPNLTFDGSMIHDGSPSFYVNAAKEFGTENYIPIDPTKTYRFSINVKATETISISQYWGFQCYDIDKKKIEPHHVMYQPNSLTELASDLKDGDMKIYFKDLSKFYKDATQGFQKGLIFWNYKNNQGYQYEPETYSRNSWPNLWADSNSINLTENSITLTNAWNRGTIPAGTKVSQSNSGSSYNYVFLGGLIYTTEWQKLGKDVSGYNVGGKTGTGTFQNGTAFIKLRLATKVATKIWFNNISMIDVSEEAKAIANATQQINTAKAEIKVTTDGIASNVSKNATDISGLKTTTATMNTKIDQKADSVTLQATKTELQESINNMDIGGENLAYSLGGNNYNIERVYGDDRSFVTIETVNNKKWLKVIRTSGSTFRLASIGLEPNTTYTYSFDAYSTTARTLTLSTWGKSSTSGSSSYATKNINVGTSPKRFTFTFTTTEYTTTDILHVNSLLADTPYYFADFQLEKGNKATNWKPSQKDTDNKLSQMQADITLNSNEIALRASKTEVTQAINNIQIGGRNLLKNSGFDTDSLYWNTANGTKKLVEDGYNGKGLEVNISNSQTVTPRQVINYNFQVGDILTGQAKIKNVDSADIDNIKMRFANTLTLERIGKKDLGNSWYLYTFQGTVVTAFNPSNPARNFGFFDCTGTFIFDEIMLEVGTKPSNYQPSLEDTTERIEQAEASIKVNSDAINLRATKTEVTNAINTSNMAGRNFVKGSDKEVTNNYYCVSNWEIVEPLVEGEQYTVSICITPAIEVPRYALYFSGGYASPANIYTDGTTNKQIISVPFTMAYKEGRTPDDDISYANPQIFRFPNPTLIENATNTTIHWLKIEKGRAFTGYSKANEDFEDRIEVNEAQLAIQANEILGKVSKTDYATDQTNLNSRLETMNTTISQKANQIELDALETDFTNLAIGGYNFLPNADFSETVEYVTALPEGSDGSGYYVTSMGTNAHGNIYPYMWGGYNGGLTNATTSVHAHIDAETFGFNTVHYDNSSSNTWKGISARINASKDSYEQGNLLTGVYTFSADVYTDKISSSILHGGFLCTLIGGTTQAFHGGHYHMASTKTNEWHRLAVNVTLPANVDFSKLISFYIYGFNEPGAKIWIKNVQVEYGNKATTFTLGKDLNDKLVSLESRLENAEIKIDSDSIVNTVTSSEAFNFILEQKANTDELEKMATTEDLENQINSIDFNSKIDSRVLDYINDPESNMNLNFVTQSQLTQTKNEINAQFGMAGGLNLIHNSLGFGGLDDGYWQPWMHKQLLTVDTAEKTFNLNSSWVLVPGTAVRHYSYYGLKAGDWVSLRIGFYPAKGTGRSLRARIRIENSDASASQNAYGNIIDSTATAYAYSVASIQITDEMPYLRIGIQDPDWADNSVASTEYCRYASLCKGAGTYYYSNTQNSDIQYCKAVYDKDAEQLGFKSSIEMGVKTSDWVRLYQPFPTEIGKTYTLSYYYKNPTGRLIDGLIVDSTLTTILSESRLYTTEITTGYQYFSTTFTATEAISYLKLQVNSNGQGFFTGIIVHEGTIPLKWSQAAGETFNTNIMMDINGIKVMQEDDNGNPIGYTSITPKAFAGYYDTDGDGTYEEIFSLKEDAVVSKRSVARNEIMMGNIKIINLSSGGYKGWAFVPTTPNDWSLIEDGTEQ